MGSLSVKMDAGYVCIRGGVPGLFGSYEGLVAVGPGGDVWAALLDDDGVELYTLGSKAGGAPPPVFDAWRKGFSYKEVKRLDVPYAPG